MRQNGSELISVRNNTITHKYLHAYVCYNIYIYMIENIIQNSVENEISLQSNTF